MKFGLIICTYRRPKAIQQLMDSLKNQMLYPDEILIIDGTPENSTSIIFKNKDYKNLKYFQVDEKNRGLTRQRNIGISKASKDVNILCFLDDDVILETDYFLHLLKTYEEYPVATGVGGYIVNEVNWYKSYNRKIGFDEYQHDGWVRDLGNRNSLRKKFGLLSNQPPGVMPEFSNGLSISFLPPTGKVYPVEFFMGGVASYKKELFEDIKFSNYFDGYGLYEDLDFCLRASKLGKLYVNTSARLYHYHEETGRPNNFRYGQMVVRNGWYVWRQKNPNPTMKTQLKWHVITFLLTLVRFGNVFSTQRKKAALTESVGRIVGWFSLIFNKPEIEK